MGEILDVMNEAEKIGQAFVELVLTSRALGHADIRDTARDCLLPAASADDRSPEHLFVLAAVAGPAAGGMRPDELLPDDDVSIKALASGPLTPLT